ncbi:YihY/virulence factor BrkB family protein [Bdellovibrio sp. 22V]|uniref:YihY/virulence factor BrkB family protein n=1 Tax=Bdellovibrio TaxID=958 RepID=UPI002542A940|nr:YihY/virulence factor BrkB family protein [Bdellovibrio sp. 22V]WII72468.1 YihY/virulence factor BrkB family protein [Bdellovibrio sp. 22V]
MKQRVITAYKRIFSGQFIDKLDRDKILDLAASLSYYTALSFAPLLVLLLTFVSFLGDNFKQELLMEVEGLVGGRAQDTIKAIAKNASQTPEVRDWAGLAGLITLLFSAGAIFSQLRMSLNIIFEVREEDLKKPEKEGFFVSAWNFIKQKIFSMGMVLTFVFISIVSLVVSSMLSMFLSGTAAILGEFINLGVSFLVFSFLFAAIYYFLPQRQIRPGIAFTAGAITAILFSIGKSLIGMYLGQSAVANLYGAAGSLIVFLMWVYYSSIIIFISAEIANEINKAEWERQNVPEDQRSAS